MTTNNRKMINVLFFIINVFIMHLYSVDNSYGKEELEKNNNFIVIDKDKNSISIGGIHNDGDVEKDVEKETVIDNMLIINNGKKIYIKHNKKKNKSEPAREEDDDK